MPREDHHALLLFADISGFTSYIRNNPWTQAHAIDAIHKLLDAVIDRIEPVFRLAKLEGDAAFCHMPTDTLSPTRSGLAAMLADAFRAFSARQSELVSSNHCQCLTCKGLANLQLKIILHSGNIAMTRTRIGIEPGGLPVIVLHRLGKNRVAGQKYIMWTEAAAAWVSFDLPPASHIEYCEGIGRIRVFVHTHLPGSPPLPIAGPCSRIVDFFTKAWLWLPLNLARIPGKSAAFREPVPETVPVGKPGTPGPAAKMPAPGMPRYDCL
jgi:hypothetical protein